MTDKDIKIADSLRDFVMREMKVNSQAIMDRVTKQMQEQERRMLEGWSAVKRFLVMLDDEGGVANWRFDTKDDAQTFLDYMKTKGVDGTIYESCHED